MTPSLHPLLNSSSTVPPLPHTISLFPHSFRNMAALLPRYRCLSCRLASAKPSLRPLDSTSSSISARRHYATTPDPSSPAPGPARRATKFNDRLNSGPAFADFVGGKPEETMTRDSMLELRTAMVGPAGKKKQITRLPEWLKTPIPVSNNYKKIKNDLRGLGLHTGGSRLSSKGIGYALIQLTSLRGSQMSQHFRLLGGIRQGFRHCNNNAYG